MAGGLLEPIPNSDPCIRPDAEFLTGNDLTVFFGIEVVFFTATRTEGRPLGLVFGIPAISRGARVAHPGEQFARSILDHQLVEIRRFQSLAS